MCKNLQADFGRYKTKSLKEKIYVFFEQGFWAVAIYRLGRWTAGIKIPLLGCVLRFFAFLLFKFTEMTTGISIPSSVKIGANAVVVTNLPDGATVVGIRARIVARNG